MTTTVDPIARALLDHPLLIVDGALATELEARGCDLNDSLWSARVLAENPELIRQVHLDYFRAGADIAITSSYQATLEGYMARGMSEAEALELITRSVTLAVEARDDFWREAGHEGRPKPLVAASVGPYGAYLADGSEYRGHYDIDEAGLVDFHRARMAALAAAGADVLACETLPSLIEAKALVTVLREFPDMSAWITFTAHDGEHISEGTPIAECARWLNDQPQVAALGVNCTALEHIPSLLEQMSGATDKPLIVYPNSGETYDANSKTWQGGCDAAHGAGFGEQAAQWYARGARLIGGCCRTTPEDVRAISAFRAGL
ncbi:homocysteine S-methyltransferase [Kushneria sp. Sum13]|uniref:homocysteine S-methyltransferase n=1 Tax=Kushneria sp. Sum13 TaxID=3459196 RepID=UPI0040467626